MTYRIYLVHWNVAEAREKAAIIRVAGYDVSYEPPTPAIFRQIKKKAPDLFLIDLSRLPSQGRDVALNIRQSKITRRIPIIFVDGDREKVLGVKKHLPDALYTSWKHIAGALRRALADPPQNPVAPRTALDGYADAPLRKKLGIKEGTQMVLINAAPDFIKKVGKLPKGCGVRRRLEPSSDLIIWFARSRNEIERCIVSATSNLSDKGGLWLAWPKKASGVKSDLSQPLVRKIGLANGLVDYKISSFDETWSGLKFAKRKSK
jgi:CheY-like chemotaxis protein